jgi:hypothetical protein
MADDEPEIADAEGEAEDGNNAPEPVEEVEMSVLDALKEVHNRSLRSMLAYPKEYIRTLNSVSLFRFTGLTKGHDPWRSKEGIA